MKICFLISGIARTYLNYLHKFFLSLKETNLDFHVYINFSNDIDTNYYNSNNNLNILDSFSFYKSIIYSKNKHNDKSKKENNILNQWYRLYSLFYTIDNSYDLYIRIRPDIELLIDINNFINLLISLNKNAISIPNGYDFYNGINLST